MQNPCIKLVRVRHDGTARAVTNVPDRESVAFPTLHRPHTVPEMFRDLFPTGQNHANIVAWDFRICRLYTYFSYLQSANMRHVRHGIQRTFECAVRDPL